MSLKYGTDVFFITRTKIIFFHIVSVVVIVVATAGLLTGLGLALVFEIVKLHNGRIRVESTPGVGTRFEISIPRHPQGIIARRSHEVGVVYDFSERGKREKEA